MAHASTKYERIPPRFRKDWIKGRAETMQKKLEAPAEDFSISVQSVSDSDQPESVERSTSRSHSISPSTQGSSSLDVSPPLHKRPRTSETSASRTESSGKISSNDKGAASDATQAIAYSGPSSIRQIVDSVVSANVARSTPPASRSQSPLGGPDPRKRCRQSSQSRPATRTNSPAPGTRSSTPVPSGWSALTSRHSFRRFDIRPRGPRHLEYDYNKARKEFQGAAYYALGQYGYEPPKGVARFKAPPLEDLPSMSDLRKVPEFAKACRKLDAADKALEDALGRGETWENTPIPEEYLKLSLENAVPEDFCVRRPDSTVVLDRSRSSVTLEEAAGQMKSSMLARSSTTNTSVPSSASVSDRGGESVIGEGGKSSRSTSPLAKAVLSDEQPPSSSPSASPQPDAEASAPASDEIRKESRDASEVAFAETGSSRLSSGKDVPHSQSSRKRQLSEVESESGVDSKEDKNIPPETTKTASAILTRPNSPSIPPVSGQTGEVSLGRTESESTAASGSTFGSGAGEGALTRESPPTSVSSIASKSVRSRGRGGRGGRGGRVGRPPRMRGRRRGRGS